MYEAERIYSQSFNRLTLGFGEVFSFRRVSVLGLPSALDGIRQESEDFALAMAYDPSNEELFKDRSEFLKFVGGVEGLAAKASEDQIGTYNRAIDAASLIFAHSVIDAVAFDLCVVTSLVAPERWESRIEKQTASLADMKSLGYEGLMKKKIRSALEDLEKRSLLDKADQIFRICQPAPGQRIVRLFDYDRAYLEKLDGLRHDIVHGRGARFVLPNGDQDLHFLRNSTLHLFGIVHLAFGVKVIPEEYLPSTQT